MSLSLDKDNETSRAHGGTMDGFRRLPILRNVYQSIACGRLYRSSTNAHLELSRLSTIASVRRLIERQSGLYQRPLA